MANKKGIDAKVIRRCQEGDMEAFTEIYEAYKNSVFYFVTTLVKSKEDAEEVVQDTFVNVLKNISTLQKPSSFGSWINSIAYNTAMQVHRKNAKYVQLDEDYDLENIVEGKEGPTEMLHRNELVEVVQTEIEKMPDKFVRVAQLRYFDNLTTREIASIMDIPEGTVKNRLNRIRETLKPALTSKGYTPAKYFSFTLTPLIGLAFANIINSHGLASETSTRIFSNVVAAAGVSTGAGASAIATASIFASKGASKAVKALKVTVVGSTALVAGVVGYSIIEPNNPYISQITHYNEVTNESVDVSVKLSSAVNKSDISIIHNGKVQSFDLTNDSLVFTAKENGEYSISIEGDKENVNISNIDKSSPSLSSADYNDGVLKLALSDSGSGIDYAKSNATYQGKKFAINSDNTIKGEFDGKLDINIVDKAGNTSEYAVEVK